MMKNKKIWISVGVILLVGIILAIVLPLTLGNSKKIKYNISFDSQTVVYDGELHYLEVVGDIPQEYEVVYDNNGHKDVGIYEVKATIKKQESIVEELSASLTIIKAKISNISLNDLTVPYDEQEHFLSISGDLPEDVVVSYENNGKVNAGTYEVVAHFSESKNYEPLGDLKAILTIEQVDLDLESISFTDKEFTYDGILKELKVDGNLPKGIIAKYENNAQIDAGIYEAKVIFEDTLGNYKSLGEKKAKLIINKATYDMSNVLFQTLEVIYDGNVHSILVEGELPEGVRILKYTDNEKVNAGTYLAIVEFVSDNVNYNPVERMEAMLTIKKASYDMSKVKFENQTFIYDGELHTLSIEGDLPTGVKVNYSLNHLKDVGQLLVTASFTIPDEQNYEPIPSKQAYLTIVPETLSVSLANQTFPYDGKQHFLELEGDLPLGVVAQWENNGQIEIGSYEVTVSFNIEAYASLTATLTIVTADIDMSNIYFYGQSFVYDGQPHTIEITGELPELVKVSYINNTRTEPGRQTAIAVFEVLDKKHYNEIPNMTAELVIIENQIEGITFQDKTFIYNQTYQSIYVEGDLPEGIIITYTNNGKKNVGVYEVTASFEDTTGVYGHLDDMVAKMTILPARFAQNGVLFLDKQFTYDGKVHSVEIYCNDLPSDIIVKYENNNQVDAGTYRVKVSFIDLEENYYPVPDMYATLTIHKKKVNMDHIRFENEEYEYDGNPHSLVIHGELPSDVQVEYSPNTLTKLGRIEVTVTFIVDEKNYEPIPSRTAFLTITKGELPDIYLVDKTVTYDGNVHSVELSGILPSGVSIHMINNDKTEAGTYIVTAELSDSEGFYNSLKATLTILTAVYDVQFSFLDETVVYDGNPHTLTITGDVPEGVQVVYSTNSKTTAGTLVVTASFIGNPNYEPIPLMTATLTILKREITGIIFESATYTYDGRPHRVDVIGLDDYPVDIYYYNNNKVDAGEYEVLASFILRNDNYSIVPNMTAQLIISPIPLGEIHIDEQFYILDGTEHYFNVDLDLPDGIIVRCLNDGQIYEGTYEITVIFESVTTNYILPDPIVTHMTIQSDGSFHTLKFHLSETQTELRVVENGKSLEDIPSPLPRLGYEGYYDEEFTMVNSPMEVYPKYRPALFHISFNVEGVEDIPVYYLDEYTLPTPVLDEYAFKNWADSSGNVVEAGTYLWTENILLYAVFQCKVVIKNPNEHVYEELYLDSTECISPEFPYSSYFKGFYLDKEYNEPFDASKPVERNLELYVKYEYDFSFVIEEEQAIVEEILDKTKTKYLFTELLYDLYPIISIPDEIFSGCSQVEEIGLPYLESDFGCLFGTLEYDNSVLVEQRQGSFYLPNTLRTVRLDMEIVPTFAFLNCQMIETLYLENIEMIEGYAFSNCTGLEEIHIQNCKIFDESIFNGCTGINIVHTDSISSWMNLRFYNILANPMYYAQEILVDGTSLEYLDLDEVEEIADYQFYGWNQIEQVYASNVLSIGNEAFIQCSSLDTIWLSSQLEEIHLDAFAGCEQLKTVYYAGTLENWAQIAFENQYSTPMVYNATCYTKISGEYGIEEELDLENIESLMDYQYYGFKNLKVIYAQSIEELGIMSLANLDYLEKIYISKKLNNIKNNAFMDTIVSKVYYEDDVTDWLNITFDNLYSTPLWSNSGNIIFEKTGLGLENLILDETVGNVDAFQFFGFRDLKNVELKGDITSIGRSAFSGCISLESFSFSSNDQMVIMENAFLNCEMLQNVYYSKTMEDYTKIQFANTYSNPLCYNAQLWIQGSAIEELVITSNPKQYQYYGLSSLRKVTLGENVKQIGAYAFASCDNLEEIVNLEQVEVLGVNAFEGDSSLVELSLNSVQNIPNSCFMNCSNLTKISIPNATKIADNAFFGCSKLTDISLESIQEIGKSSFKGCSSLASIQLNSATKIGNEAFFNCYNLEEVMLSNSLENIGYAAFYGCSNLEQIILPTSIKKIEGNAFADASKLVIYACFGAKPSAWSSSFGYGTSAIYWYSNEYKEGNYWHFGTNNQPEIW